MAWTGFLPPGFERYKELQAGTDANQFHQTPGHTRQMAGGLLQSARILAMATGEAGRWIGRQLRNPLPLSLTTTGKAPRKLLLAPQDLYTADPSRASDLYSGLFSLSGTTLDCGNSNPFSAHDADFHWQRELQGFGWIRHLEKEGSARSRSNIQARIADWIRVCGKPSSSIAWQNDVTARRLISWLCHSVPVVENATPEFYGQWLKSIGVHVRYLNARCDAGPPGLQRLLARIALAYAAICVDGLKKSSAKAQLALARELGKQVLADGSHLTRNPQVLLDLLALLLPLRESFRRLGIAPDQQIISAIDRMMAAVDFFRLGDGNLVRFNGSHGGRPDLLATILHYDDVMGKAAESATASGYERMELGSTILVADTGVPPYGICSSNACAGTLAFELSSGNQLLMVNCGMPVQPDQTAESALRATAAHNTLGLNDASSSRFYQSGLFAALLGNRRISGVTSVDCQRQNTSDSKQFEASHDGYWSSFGVLHRRKIRLAANGDRIEGTDTLSGRNGKQLAKRAKADFTIRFHLHPSVSAGKTDNGMSVLLMCGGGHAWKLTCIDAPPQIEDSVYFSPASGPRRSKQVVLQGDGHATPEVRWLLTRQQISEA